MKLAKQQKNALELRGKWFYEHFTRIIARCDKEIARLDADLRWTRAEIVRWPDSADLKLRLLALQKKRKRIDNERTAAIFKRGRD